MEGEAAPKTVPLVLDQTAELLQGTFTTFLNEYAASAAHLMVPNNLLSPKVPRCEQQEELLGANWAHVP